MGFFPFIKISVFFFFSLNQLALVTAGKFGDFKIIGYYPYLKGKINTKIKIEKLTHLFYAFGFPSGNGSGQMESLAPGEEIIKSMMSLCQKYNIIPVLSVGGWIYPDGRRCSEIFEANTNTPAKIELLATTMVDEARFYGFQGIDIDWEDPTETSKAQYTSLIKQLRVLCNKNNMILTTAVGEDYIGYEPEALKLLDFINVMAYDYHDSPQHSPYSYMIELFNLWKDIKEIPADKLTIGVPFYGRPEKKYVDIVKISENYAQKDVAVVDGQTIYYNGIPTIKKKTEFALKNAGGIMIWEISQDSLNEKLSLLNAIYQTVKSHFS